VQPKGCQSSSLPLRLTPSPSGRSELAQLVLPGGGRLLILLFATRVEQFPLSLAVALPLVTSLLFIWGLLFKRHKAFRRNPLLRGGWEPRVCWTNGAPARSAKTGREGGGALHAAGLKVLRGCQAGPYWEHPSCKKRLLLPWWSWPQPLTKGWGLQGTCKPRTPACSP